METRITTRGGHSADVRIALAVNGHVFNVAELGPDFVVLRNPLPHPPAEAEITLSIDGQVERWQVELLDGIVADGGDTRFRSCVGQVNGTAGGQSFRDGSPSDLV
jgi:hypothetical protein